MRPLLILLLSSFFLPSASAQEIPEKELDSLFQLLDKHDKWMGSVAVSRSGKPVYERAIGYRLMTENDSIEANRGTRYRIGSVTKMFTSTLVMQLVENGELELSTPLSEFYPEIPNADSITIDRMLRHRTGIHNFTSDTAFRNYMEEGRTREEMLEMFRSMEPDTVPGAETSYSNSNYVLLSYIIEKVSGSTYSEALQNGILEPAGLEETGVGDSLEADKNEAFSYFKSGKSWNEATETDMGIPQGAGAITATPRDLTRFAHALFHGELLSASSIDKMKEAKGGLGRGLFPIPFKERKGYGHTGGIDGFSAILFHLPEDSLSVALASNGAAFSNQDILKGILKYIYDEPYELPEFRSVDIPSEELDRYTGVYHSDTLGMDLEIDRANGGLTAQATGQPQLPLSAASSTEFRYDRAGVVIRFRKLEEEKYRRFILEQGGGVFDFVRK